MGRHVGQNALIYPRAMLRTSGRSVRRGKATMTSQRLFDSRLMEAIALREEIETLIEFLLAEAPTQSRLHLVVGEPEVRLPLIQDDQQRPRLRLCQ